MYYTHAYYYINIHIEQTAQFAVAVESALLCEILPAWGLF